METDMFKKLVWLLPNFKYNNPDDRYDDYSVETNFTNGVSMSATVQVLCNYRKWYSKAIMWVI